MASLMKRSVFGIALVLAVFVAALLAIGAYNMALAGNGVGESETEALDTAFPNAEVVHVIAESNAGEVTETWIDQLSADVLKKTSDEKGTISQVEVRHDTTVSNYVVTGQSAGFYERTVLSANDPFLSQITSDLDGFRLDLEQGTLVKVDEEEFQGQRALKAQFPTGELAGTIVYLDPVTLYPLGHIFPGAEASIITYKTIETLRRADVPDGTFQFDPPVTDYRESYQQLSTEDIERFSVYPLVNLGTTFGEYELFRIERYQSHNTGHDGEDKTYSIYRHVDSSTKAMVEVQVMSRPPLSEKERAGVERAVKDGVLAPAEPVTEIGRAHV